MIQAGWFEMYKEWPIVNSQELTATLEVYISFEIMHHGALVRRVSPVIVALYGKSSTPKHKWYIWYLNNFIRLPTYLLVGIRCNTLENQ